MPDESCLPIGNGPCAAPAIPVRSTGRPRPNTRQATLTSPRGCHPHAARSPPADRGHPGSLGLICQHIALGANQRGPSLSARRPRCGYFWIMASRRSLSAQEPREPRLPRLKTEVQLVPPGESLSVGRVRWVEGSGDIIEASLDSVCMLLCNFHSSALVLDPSVSLDRREGARP